MSQAAGASPTTRQVPAGTEAQPSAGGGALDIRGPHVALAVRLMQRDPGRTFVLGERLPYVLLAGTEKQDDAAESPLVALRRRLRPNLALYWTNKMSRALGEIFAPCLPPARLQDLLHGAHTRVRVDELPGSSPPVAAPATPSPGKRGGGPRQAGLFSFYKPTDRCLGCRRPLTGNLRQPTGAAYSETLCTNCVRCARGC